jgi:hypothetical protein
MNKGKREILQSKNICSILGAEYHIEKGDKKIWRMQKKLTTQSWKERFFQHSGSFPYQSF